MARKRKSAVYLFGQKYDIKYMPIMGNGTYGLFSPEKKLIIVDNSLSPEDEQHTMVHEEMHGVLYRTGIEQAISNELMEVICQSTATYVTETYHLRPKKWR